MHELKDYDTISIRINGEIYNLWVADSDIKQKIGLSGIDHLPKNYGMLFTYDKPCQHAFTMKNTSIPLTIIFLDTTGNVINHKSCKPFQKEKIRPSSKYSFVIEI